MLYEQLSNYQSLQEKLPQDRCACVTLLKTSENSGHWITIAKYNNNVYYMDS